MAGLDWRTSLLKPSKRLVRILGIFVKKDWIEFRRPLIFVTGLLLIAVLILTFSPSRQDLARGIMAAVLLGAPFVYAQSCFYMERQPATLQFRLALPITSWELVLAKFASLFSLTVFTVNIPGLVLGDLHVLFYGNALTLFLATLFMSATVISDKPWAPQLPLWFVVILTLPFHRQLNFQWIISHATQFALTALLLIPVMVVVSAWIFSRNSSN